MATKDYGASESKAAVAPPVSEPLVVPRFDPASPTLLTETGGVLNADPGTEEKQFRVTVNGATYEHCSDAVVVDEDGETYKRWVYRRSR